MAVGLRPFADEKEGGDAGARCDFGGRSAASSRR